MHYAINLAQYAAYQGEIPVGAVLIKYDEIIGKGYNSIISKNDPTAHAEIIALKNGSKKMANYRLLDTIMYVTLEPCIMCFGAMVNARINRLVFSIRNKRFGTITSSMDIVNKLKKNHQIIFTEGILTNRYLSQLKNFFYNKRIKNKKNYEVV